MNVVINSDTSAITVAAPLSKAGDSTSFRTEMDLIIGMTACSAPQSNNYAFKPIQYRIDA
ncbi:MAG: hypothetical protein M0D54_22120 [Hyphomonadaceae bacterium JAD_PAG50586_4]|nr:MAG: hypothetical protein M0D54_22120 [Hyphomonadaceae bacterium JAD_PAG50586_4]